jgi:protein-tyrosine phosphatase
MEKRKPLRIDWLPGRYTAPGTLGIARLPGHEGTSRGLQDDLHALQAAGVSHVVALVSDDELGNYGVEGLFEAYREAGFVIRRLPIPDMGISSVEDMAGMVAWLDEQLREGARVLVHCVGGLGRSGMAAACYLTTRGLDAGAAIAEVRRARSPYAIETTKQEAFVRRFAGKYHRRR